MPYISITLHPNHISVFKSLMGLKNKARFLRAVSADRSSQQLTAAEVQSQLDEKVSKRAKHVFDKFLGERPAPPTDCQLDHRCECPPKLLGGRMSRSIPKQDFSVPSSFLLVFP